jgi:hypothetical protein
MRPGTRVVACARLGTARLSRAANRAFGGGCRHRPRARHHPRAYQHAPNVSGPTGAGPLLPRQKSMRFTTRRRHRVRLDGPGSPLAGEVHRGTRESATDAALAKTHAGEQAGHRPDAGVGLVLLAALPRHAGVADAACTAGTGTRTLRPACRRRLAGLPSSPRWRARQRSQVAALSRAHSAGATEPDAVA